METIPDHLAKILHENFYSDIKILTINGTPRVCGIQRMMFTVGLFYGLDETGYIGRYCYENADEAREALKTWNGENDPPGDWIKHKGHGIDQRNAANSRHTFNP